MKSETSMRPEPGGRRKSTSDTIAPSTSPAASSTTPTSIVSTSGTSSTVTAHVKRESPDSTSPGQHCRQQQPISSLPYYTSAGPSLPPIRSSKNSVSYTPQSSQPLGSGLPPETPRKEPHIQNWPSSCSSSASSRGPHTPNSNVMATTMLKGATATPTQRISRAKKGKRVHVCNHPGCEKVFTRAEHLRRHQLNHSTEVYYKCDLCERTFVRQDLLTRHTERHASQARKAVQTLALTQRHRQFSSHFGINGVAILGAPHPSPHPTSDYGPNGHLYDTSIPHPQRPPGADTTVPEIINLLSTHHQTPATSPISPLHASSAGYTPGYPAPIPLPLSQPTEPSPSAYVQTDTSGAPPVGGMQRSHLPFHLQHNEPQRQPEPYMIPVNTHADIIRKTMGLAVEAHSQISHHPQHPPQQPPPPPPSAPPVQHSQQAHSYANNRPWDGYGWLFDDSIPEHVLMELNPNQVPFLHALEVQHYGAQGEVAASKMGTGDAFPTFHSIGEEMREQILMLIQDAPNLHTGNVGSAAMQGYLRLYWTEFHPNFPLLHRPTFVPGLQMPMLVAIVLAIGASFAEAEAGPFAMAVYEKVRGWILNSEEFPSHSPSVITQQLVLLADMFGKMRSTRPQPEGAQLDLILLNSLRRSDIGNTDPLQVVRRYHRQGYTDFDFQNEWQAWIELESKKRVALFFFYWEAQQAVLFGREMRQTVLDVRIQLPCDEFLWSAATPGEWFNKLEGVQEGIGLLEVIKIFLDGRREPPPLSPLGMALVVHCLVAIGLDLQKQASSPIIYNPGDTVSKQARISRALDIWRGHFDTVLAPVVLQECSQRVLVMYHMAYIALHTNRQSLFVGAGDRRFYSRESDDFYRSKAELQHWAATPSAQLATWHSVQILLRYLGGTQLHYENLYLTWSVYVAALVCYTFGNASTSPIGEETEQGVMVWNYEQDMSTYLQMMNTNTWESLAHVRRYHRGRTDGLLTLVRNTLKPARWGLIQEGMEVLKNLGSIKREL